MSYYNPYPGPYQIQQQPQQNGIIWVQGEAAAKSYLVAPNSTVQLWDSEAQTIYLKSADASGMPSIKVLDYTIRGDETKTEYATKEDLKALTDKIRSLREDIRKLTEADDE